MNKYIILFFNAFIVVCAGCTKETVRTNNLQEILIGEWQVTETVDFFVYSDTLWHEASSQTKLTFQTDSIAIFDYGGSGNFLESSSYFTEGNKAIVFGTPIRSTWMVSAFDERFLEIDLGVDQREGAFKSRWIKIE